jgi:hypothetical protein
VLIEHPGTKRLTPEIEAEGQMKHEDRLELQQGKADRRKAETGAKEVAESKVKNKA